MGAPSAWMGRFAPLVRKTGTVLDLACGGGRHLRHFHRLGHPVVGVDIDTRGVADLTGADRVEIVTADLEGGPWPFPGRHFSAIVVANYLHRPLLDDILAALEPRGLLLYETFAVGNGRFGRPSCPAYLLRAGELLDLVRGRLQVVAYEHGEVASPKAAVVQRLAAINDLAPAADLDGDPDPAPLPAP